MLGDLGDTEMDLAKKKSVNRNGPKVIAIVVLDQTYERKIQSESTISAPARCFIAGWL
jgi:hypothetical protein